MEDETGRVWWEAKHFYQPPQDHPYAVILLNEAVDLKNLNFFAHVWQKASVRVCVDGATNFIHKLRGNNENILKMSSAVNCGPSLESSLAQMSLGSDCSLLLPHFISGDFDSIHPDLLTHYKELGVDIIPTPDQNETDFTKAVRELGLYITKRNMQLKHVLVITAVNNERFDHMFANLSTLYKVGKLLPTPVVIMSGGSLFWLLSEGDHTIKVTQEIVLNRRRSWCGLVPLGYPATVTTTGLKWNLDNQVLGFGHVISTSNTYNPVQDGQVTITTCQPLLWTMGWDIEKLYPARNCGAVMVPNGDKIEPSSSSLPIVNSESNRFVASESAYCP